MNNSMSKAGIDTGSIFFNEYDKEVVFENLAYDLNKTRNSLFIIGGLLLIGDLVSLWTAQSLNGTTLIYALLAPAMFIGLGLLAKRRPILSMSLAAFFLLLFISYTAYVAGASSILNGLLLKAILVYLFIRGFGHAKNAEEGKRKIALFN